MGKKIRLVPERPPTKRQNARWQKEARLQKLILIVSAAVLAVAILIPLSGYAYESYSNSAKGREPVLKVNDTEISTDYYVKRVYFGLYLLDLQSAATGGASSQTFGNQRSYMPIQLIEDLTTEELVKQEAKKRSITVSGEEIDKELRDEMLPALGPDEKVDEAKREADFKDTYNGILKNGKLSDKEFRDMVEISLLRKKLTEELSNVIVSPAEQVHVRGMLFNSEDEAKAFSENAKGGADFGKLVDEATKKQQPEPTPTPQTVGPPTQPTPGSTDQTAPVLNGGDLGWLAKGKKSWAFDEVAFGLNPGEISEPFQTPEGYWVLKVEEKANSREIDQDTLDTLKIDAFNYWLEGQQKNAKIERKLNSDKYGWVMDRVTKMGPKTASADR